MKIFRSFSKNKKEFLNFECIIIKKLKNLDISDKLLNDYGGFIGELYYSL